MSFGGGGAPPTPTPEPIPQPPIRDDPNKLEEARRDASRARRQEGYNKHLLSGPEGDTSLSGTKRKTLIG